jgi:serine/threonine-protein kinase
VSEGGEGEPIAGGGASPAAESRSHALVGKTLLDRYRIEELVAMGGLAAVFRATRLANGEEVAIKVLHPDIEGLPELVERFKREAIAGKHILHENVVAVHELAQLDDGSYFLVQEFVRGRTLRALIDEGPVAPLRAARIARQLAEALTAAHDFGIVHRDVKPLNVMLLDGPSGADRVKLIDFGLAKVPVEELAVLDGEGRRSLTQAGVVMGTVAYMAPEAAFGMRVIDRRSDLYAVGLILYEMLAGKHPFTATEPTALFAQQRKEIPPPIAARSPGVVVPPVLEAVVHQLLAKDPDARHPRARAVVVALDAAIREMEEKQAPAAPPPPGLLVRLARPPILIGGIVLLAAALAWFFATR